MLEGKKTYLVALGIVLVAFGGFLNGDLSLLEAVTQGLVGLGLGAVRRGIETK